MRKQIRNDTFYTSSINKGEALAEEYGNYGRYDPYLIPLKNLSDNIVFDDECGEADVFILQCSWRTSYGYRLKNLSDRKAQILKSYNIYHYSSTLKDTYYRTATTLNSIIDF